MKKRKFDEGGGVGIPTPVVAPVVAPVATRAPNPAYDSIPGNSYQEKLAYISTHPKEHKTASISIPNKRRLTSVAKDKLMAKPGAERYYRSVDPNRGARTPTGMEKGGEVKKYAKGGSIDGVAQRGKTRGKMC
jgi:hypothetical protein